MDEQIARMATAQLRAENPRSIKDGEIMLNERFYDFEKVSLFEDKLRVYLPTDFTDMPEEFVRVKYPNSDRPKIIKSDERGAATFTFNILESPLDKNILPRLASEAETMLRRLNPAWIFFEQEEEGEQNPNVGSFSYKSAAADGTVYNLMFFAAADGKTMMGTFSCPYGEHEAWEKVLPEILSLIETGGEEEQNA
jgi:hypothetical protein